MSELQNANSTNHLKKHDLEKSGKKSQLTDGNVKIQLAFDGFLFSPKNGGCFLVLRQFGLQIWTENQIRTKNKFCANFEIRPKKIDYYLIST